MNSKLEQYFENIKNQVRVAGIFWTGSRLEGLEDKYSDTDWHVICQNKLPVASNRLMSADKLGLVIHEIKDIQEIRRNFDMFEIDGELHNIVYEFQEEINRQIENLIDKAKWDYESILNARNFTLGEIVFDPTNWLLDKKQLCMKPLRKDIKEKIIEKCHQKISWFRNRLVVCVYRQDTIEFLHYMLQIILYLQISDYIGHGAFPPSTKRLIKRCRMYEINDLADLVNKIEHNVSLQAIYDYIVDDLDKRGIMESDKIKA